MNAISEITKRYLNGAVDYLARIYLGAKVSERVLQITCTSDELIPRRWRQTTPDHRWIWQLELKQIKPGTGLSFRLDLKDGSSVPYVPLGESDVVNGVVRIPDYNPEWLKPTESQKSEKARLMDDGMAILLEHSLEGLLADYEESIYYTDAMEELLDWSIADRIMKTDIPEQLGTLGYTEVMFPLYASVADRCNLNPKYNYLVYNLSPDWQLGSARDLRHLVHRFRACEIELVPDLVFVHQVGNPFDGSSGDLNLRKPAMRLFQDPDPFLFRDYGTWHFDLQDPLIREIIIDKIIETILLLDFHIIRVDYIDGLLMQYVNRPVNFGAVLLHELKQRLQHDCPGLKIIGEAFQTADDPAVSTLIDSFYSPRGFALLDLLLAPGSDHSQVVHGAVDGLTAIINAVSSQSRAESNYSQLHDECWQDEWIRLGRKTTPWAYGSMPLGLALRRVDELIKCGWFDRPHRLPMGVALMLLLRNLGLAVSLTRWMETTGCLSLAVGRLDDDDHWKYPWSCKGPLSRQLFPAEGLSHDQRQKLLIRARANVAAANHVFRRVGASEMNPWGPPLKMLHGDVQSGLVAFVRWGRSHPNPALVIVNLSPIEAAGQSGYALNLQDVGWSPDQGPQRLISVTQPLLGVSQEPLVLNRYQESPFHFHLNRPLHGFESAICEVPLHV